MMTIEKIRKQWFPVDAETSEVAYATIRNAEEALARAQKAICNLNRK